MKHIGPLFIKFLMSLAVTTIILGLIYNVTFGDILFISILLTGISYFLGDLFILPRYGNTVATIADFGVTFIATWLLGIMVIERIIPLGIASFFVALFISLGEILFHRYMESSILGTHHSQHRNKKFLQKTNNVYQTEFAEEKSENVNKIYKKKHKR